MTIHCTLREHHSMVSQSKQQKPQDSLPKAAYTWQANAPTVNEACEEKLRCHTKTTAVFTIQNAMHTSPTGYFEQGGSRPILQTCTE